MKLNIPAKIILGYVPLVSVMILIAAYALASLNEVGKISKEIVERDIVLIEAANNMIDTLLAQESYGRRYVILQSPQMQELFWQRSKAFDAEIARIRTLQNQDNIPSGKLTVLHKEFNDLYEDWLKQLGNAPASLTKEFDQKIKGKLDELTALIQIMISDVKQNQNRQILRASGAGLKAFRLTAILSSLGILLGIGAATFTIRNIGRSIYQLKLSTREISEGKFDHVPNVSADDELGELAGAFGEMARRLARLEEVSLDANPLTRLPGGIAIENVLKHRLAGKRPVAFCLIDLDNFKSFNDRYGYAMGNQVIKTTAGLIQKSIAKYGTEGDFVGHIGGDDFAIITTPEKYERVCKFIIKKFDKKIIDFYNTDDRVNGCIKGKTRQGEEVRFPIMTVSIAVVTNEEKTAINHIQIGEIAAELKGHAKSIPGSICVVDRRGKKA
jgi:diguanylate cyclase (GGDEF)-like protein